MDREASAHDLLVDILFDESKDPTILPIGLLESITNDFSDDQKIGSGGFADVYKGQLQGGVVAVKNLKQQLEMDETKFIQEVESLEKVKHKNIVRFLGYCFNSQGEIWKLEGKNIMAEKQQRFLCFEFLPQGSLDEHINDASSGLEWRTRYHIIKGICEGLQYLHEKKIVHLDLKPENILLDHNMIPKIGDFGIARSFHEEETEIITENLVGTRCYMAPESVRGLITFKSDIYSLGIIITEILTGQKFDLSIENVYENWTSRFKTSNQGTWLEHVRVCAEIGSECVYSDPEKRPTIRHIIDRLAELEHNYGPCETHRPGTHVFDVYPLDIWFPFESSDKVTKCPVSLINKSDYFTGVWITPIGLHAYSNPDYPYVWEAGDLVDDRLESSSCFRVLFPHSSKIIYMTMRHKGPLPLQADKGMFNVVVIATKSSFDLTPFYHHWKEHGRTRRYNDPFTIAKEFGTVVHRATLRVGVTSDPARCQEEVATHKSIQAGNFSWIYCTDVHPTKTWLLVGYDNMHVSFWNYKTQERMIRIHVTDSGGFKYGDREILSSGGTTARAAGRAPRQTSKEKCLYIKEKCYSLVGKHFLRNDDRPSTEQRSPEILSIKFIAGEQWFTVGDNNGCVHVYAYTFPTGENKLTAFEAHVGKGVNCMVVQPERTMLLTLSQDDKSIKLWDWSKGWRCARVINMWSTLLVLNFNICRFACTDLIKFCNSRSSYAIATVEERLSFCTDSTHRDTLAVIRPCLGSGQEVEIWDLQTKKHTHSIYPWDHLRDLAFHPTLSILAGISYAENFGVYQIHQIVLWHVRTFSFVDEKHCCLLPPPIHAHYVGLRVMKRVQLRVKGEFHTMVFDGREDITSLVIATTKEIEIIKINALALLMGCATLI